MTDRLTRSDIPRFLGEVRDCVVVEVHSAEGVPQAVTFRMEPFQFQLQTASMMTQPREQDLDRAWLWSRFPLDAAVDLPFMNEFNGRGHAASAAITDGRVELHDHFMLMGLPRQHAELILAHHILGFKREVTEFALERNERARSLSIN